MEKYKPVNRYALTLKMDSPDEVAYLTALVDVFLRADESGTTLDLLARAIDLLLQNTVSYLEGGEVGEFEDDPELLEELLALIRRIERWLPAFQHIADKAAEEAAKHGTQET